MPDREVKTIKDLIFYQYAKHIARSALGYDNGKQAKGSSYGFIKNKFKELKEGTISWSEITREDKEFLQTEKACIYCGATNNLSWDHIVPRTLSINSRCASCDRIQGIHNQVLACRNCNSAKGITGLYAFYKKIHPTEKKFYDIIPALLEKKYLKTIYWCHECAGDLDKTVDGITVLDLDF